ncbi:MAG: hypothetical protein AAF928_11605 [Myxococcota bacterium]
MRWTRGGGAMVAMAVASTGTVTAAATEPARGYAGGGQPTADPPVEAPSSDDEGQAEAFVVGPEPVARWGQRDHGPNGSEAAHHRLALEVDHWWSGEVRNRGASATRAHTFVLTATAQLQLSEHIFLDGELPAAFSALSQGDDDTGDALLGNPALGVHHADEHPMTADGLGYWVGVMVAFPTMLADVDGTNDARVINYGQAAFVRGGARLHRFLPQTVSIRAHGGVEVRFADEVMRYRGQYAVAGYIPYGDEDVGAFAGIWIELINDLDARVPEGFGGGLRVQGVRGVFSSGGQTALGPYVFYEAPGRRGGFVRLGGLMSVGGILGTGFADDAGLAAVQGSVGGKW